MNNMNLLPWRERRRQRRLRWFLGALAASATGAALALVFVGLHIADGVERERRANDELMVALATLDTRVTAIDQLRREREAFEVRAATLRGLWRERETAVTALSALAEAVVPGIHYTHVAREGQSITIRGAAQSHEQISALMRNLADVERLETPVLKTATAAEDGQQRYGAGTAVFELSCLLAAPNSPPTNVAQQRPEEE